LLGDEKASEEARRRFATTDPGAHTLLDIVKVLPDKAKVTISIEGERATVRSGKSRFTLATLPRVTSLRSRISALSAKKDGSLCAHSALQPAALVIGTAYRGRGEALHAVPAVRVRVRVR
jgi:hypothetical protein